ncbi:phosphohistidine phosphatase [Microlunatus endophyticus]|uniref:Phosphohistidine phosphatase n=1 Tax=Microlunatus endophyticus TaxID=1716077 RepID=A0A917SJL1_9ACTN|nr:histidine phosphatase family protein [Microlunatus endophyticus]GGL81911.1 phosphohistidine phosphatase [Microlunatus endophyticus]
MSTSRRIFLLRHAKSAWGLDVPDHERPLSGRGRRDSAALGQLLAERHVNPDLVWCSTAVRARETWERAVAAGASAGTVQYDDHLYEAVAHELVKVLRKTPDDVRTVLLIGHSPAVPELVDRLAPRKGHKNLWKRMDEKFPTSGLASLDYDGNWADLSKQSARLTDFDVPRGQK